MRPKQDKKPSFQEHISLDREFPKAEKREIVTHWSKHSSKLLKKVPSNKRSIREIKKILWDANNKLHRIEGKNKLTEKYLHKVRYMLLHFRMIPINKTVLDNWYMPDYSDIVKMGEKKL